MNEADKDLIFSESVKAGKRIYYFDVKQSRNGDKYIAITESKKINEGTFENPRFVYEKHKLFLYKEDYDKFVNALNMTLDVAKGNVSVQDAVEAREKAYQAYLASNPKQQETAVEAPEAPAPADEAKAEPEPEKKSLLGKMLDIF